MWAWLKRFGTTIPANKQSALETAFLQQSKALVDLTRQQQKLISQQQHTLDRIVTAKYDRPIEKYAPPAPSEQMPLWGLNDQLDSRPDEIEAGIGALHLESDEEFLKNVSVQ